MLRLIVLYIYIKLYNLHNDLEKERDRSIEWERGVSERGYEWESDFSFGLYYSKLGKPFIKY